MFIDLFFILIFSIFFFIATYIINKSKIFDQIVQNVIPNEFGYLQCFSIVILFSKCILYLIIFCSLQFTFKKEVKWLIYQIRAR